jgi:competence protein ComEA
VNAIIRFREQHGDYESINDLKNIAIMNDEILRKIEPYLTFK